MLKRAREQGIVVITHEAASQENIDYDIEAFRNEDFGANLMEQLATCTPEEFDAMDHAAMSVVPDPRNRSSRVFTTC